MTNIYVCDLLKIEDFFKVESDIPSNCLLKARKYKLQKDYHLSMISWYMVSKYLKKVFKIDISEYDIKKNEFNKPYIDANIFFNISHSNNIACVIISDSECGIDVECFKSIKNKELLLKKLTLDLNMSDDEFIRSWSQKEAYYKMHGTGISFEKLKKNLNADCIKSIELSDSVNNCYSLSYCTSDDKVNIYNVE